jgi:hypothetical protein
MPLLLALATGGWIGSILNNTTTPSTVGVINPQPESHFNTTSLALVGAASLLIYLKFVK